MKLLNVEVAVVNREEAAGPAEAWVLRRSYTMSKIKTGAGLASTNSISLNLDN